MKKIIRLTESDLIKLVKKVIKEQTKTKAIGNNLGIIKERTFDGDGFYDIRVASINNIISIKNKYLGGETESQRKKLLSNESQEGNTIGATYWVKGNPNQTISISITGPNVSTKIDYRLKDKDWTGCMFNFTNLPAGVFTINATNDTNNSLTITVSEGCEEEWKKLYEDLEDSADNNDIDIRRYYCKSRTMKQTIEGLFPKIEESKKLCLINKVNQQYCN